MVLNTEDHDESLYPEQPLDTKKAWTEMIHRYFAGSLALLIVAIAIYSWRAHKHNSHYPLKLPLILVALVFFQAALGMWTVTWKLQPTVVCAHLLGGLATLSLLWLLWLRSRPSPVVTGVNGCMKRFGFLVLGVLIIQLALGGWVSANYAGVACPNFPYCMGSSWLGNSDFSQALQLWLPIGPNYEFGALDNPARQAIHMMHRFGALLLTVLLTFWCLWLCRVRALRVPALFTLVLLFVQIALGITNVVHHLPLHPAVTHNVVGALLLLAVVQLNYRLYKSSK
jgi:heme a synthase